MKLERDGGRWIFTGSGLPMELARKSWPDRYAAVTAAEAAGCVCYANGSIEYGETIAVRCAGCGGTVHVSSTEANGEKPVYCSDNCAADVTEADRIGYEEDAGY